MKEPLYLPEQADRWLMRQHLAAETTRVVTAVWWGVYTVPEAVRELRGQAYLIAQRNKVAPDVADAVAVNAFDEEMQRHEEEHAASREVMTQAAFAVLSAGGTEADAKAQIAAHAKDRPIPPPLNLLTQSLDEARKRRKWATRTPRRT